MLWTTTSANRGIATRQERIDYLSSRGSRNVRRGTSKLPSPEIWSRNIKQPPIISQRQRKPTYGVRYDKNLASKKLIDSILEVNSNYRNSKRSKYNQGKYLQTFGLLNNNYRYNAALNPYNRPRMKLGKQMIRQNRQLSNQDFRKSRRVEPTSQNEKNQRNKVVVSNTKTNADNKQNYPKKEELETSDAAFVSQDYDYFDYDYYDDYDYYAEYDYNYYKNNPIRRKSYDSRHLQERSIRNLYSETIVHSVVKHAPKGAQFVGARGALPPLVERLISNATLIRKNIIDNFTCEDRVSFAKSK